jgi:hypothetical protein
VSNAETQISAFLERYAPARARLGRALRAKLRRRFPGLSELVYFYENQEALVISYSPTGSAPDGLCAIGVYPDSVKLFFGQGARLSKADPGKLLQGRGQTVRHVPVQSAADIDRPEIEALMIAASSLAGLSLDPRAQGPVVMKAASQKERAARKSKARLEPASSTPRAARAERPSVSKRKATKARPRVRP